MTIMANAREVITIVKFQARLEISQVAGGHSCHRIVWTSLSRYNQYTAMYHQYQYRGINIAVLPSQIPLTQLTHDIYGLRSPNSQHSEMGNLTRYYQGTTMVPRSNHIA